MAGLGINKDLEPLAREVKRRGGDVRMTGSNHVRWTMPGGRVLYTGLTMAKGTAKAHERTIRQALDPAPDRCWDTTPAAHGKWHVINTRTGAPLLNGNGYPRTFSSEPEARAEARHLNRKGT